MYSITIRISWICLLKKTYKKIPPMFDYNTLPESLKRSNAKKYHCCCEVASVVSDSVRPQRWQPTRLCHPWDSPGKNTGMGCHFLLQCMKVKNEREVAQSCPTLSDPMDCSPPDFSIRGSFQARVLEWGAIAFSERISQTSSNTEGRKETSLGSSRCSWSSSS